MSLVGKYTNQQADALLTISHANDQNGQLTGELTTTYEGTSLTLVVSGHYHFFKSGGPETSIVFFAFHDDDPASIYEAWAGVTNRNGYTKLDVRGVRSTLTAGKAKSSQLPGDFVRNP